MSELSLGFWNKIIIACNTFRISSLAFFSRNQRRESAHLRLCLESNNICNLLLIRSSTHSTHDTFVKCKNIMYERELNFFDMFFFPCLKTILGERWLVIVQKTRQSATEHSYTHWYANCLCKTLPLNSTNALSKCYAS